MHQKQSKHSKAMLADGLKTVFKVLYQINNMPAKRKIYNYLSHAPRDEAGRDFTL